MRKERRSFYYVVLPEKDLERIPADGTLPDHGLWCGGFCCADLNGHAGRPAGASPPEIHLGTSDSSDDLGGEFSCISSGNSVPLPGHAPDQCAGAQGYDRRPDEEKPSAVPYSGKRDLSFLFYKRCGANGAAGMGAVFRTVWHHGPNSQQLGGTVLPALVPDGNFDPTGAGHDPAAQAL